MSDFIQFKKDVPEMFNVINSVRKSVVKITFIKQNHDLLIFVISDFSLLFEYWEIFTLVKATFRPLIYT